MALTLPELGAKNWGQMLNAVLSALDGRTSGLLTGTGFPEGVVAAPVGSRYVDTVATNGAVEWVKTSGTGNTGWRVVYGDTNWRAVPVTENGWTGTVFLRRAGMAIFLRLNNVSGTAATAATILTLPAGFTAASGQNGTAGVARIHTTVGNVTDPEPLAMLNAGSTLSYPAPLPVPSSQGAFWGSGSYDAPVGGSPWPTALPGTPA